MLVLERFGPSVVGEVVPIREGAPTNARVANRRLEIWSRGIGPSSSRSGVLEDGGGKGLLVRVEDDGSGFQIEAIPSDREHMGLLSMQERAEAVGGWCQVESIPGSGTTVQCWLPRSGSVADEGERADHQVARAMTPATAPRGGGSRSSREAPPGRLSAREQQVAELLAIGHTNAEVASILHLSVRTIEHHRSNVFDKLGVRSRAGLVRTMRER